MSNPYANRPQHYDQPSSALGERTNDQGYDSVAEGIAAMQARRRAEAKKPLRWTQRAKTLGAGAVSIVALGGVLWAGIHANNEANNANQDSPVPQDPTSLTHEGGQQHPDDDPSLIDYLEGDKGRPK